MRHLVQLADLTASELEALLDRAVQMKQAYQSGRRELPLAGRVMALVFEKPSLRTRVSFEAAMAQAGGTSLFIRGEEVSLGQRETVADFARVISLYVDVLVARVFEHRLVQELAAHATVPVINGLSDWSHPCQALGDLLTITECFGQVAGRTIAFIGDGNNVARSLAIGCKKLGARFVLAAPQGYDFDERFWAVEQATSGSGAVEQCPDPAAAVLGADVLYTDVWTSMGQESESSQRRKAFADYQINAGLLAKAPPTARVMHCLPAHRGEEITDEVLDGPQSIVLDQAANRLSAQKTLLVWLLAPDAFPVRRGGS
jgi:ornithine carbamoyltransferase